jgi:DNA-binding transcriptional ArsR family regulator
MSKRSLSPCDLARALFERGANVIPLSPASKEPAGRWAHWATHPQDWPDVERLFANADPEANIAALGGIHSQAVTDGWGYLALLDCDSGESLDMMRALVRAQLGADPLVSLSARGGHIWLRTPQPVRSARWPGGELRGYRAYVVAPGSIHPSGTRYKWANDGAEILRCDGLPGIPWQYVQRDRIPRLAAAIMRADERVLSRYATRSEVDWALILSLVNAGASFERVRALYLASRHPKHLDPSRRDFERRLMAEYMRAKEQGNSADYVAAREMAERVKAWALSAAFVGTSPRTRETDRRVLLAHCDRAIRAGKHEWHLSQRDIEQAAQVSAPTARIATRRLIKAGLLTRRQGFVGQYAQTYGWGRAVSSFAHLHTLGGIVSKWANGETGNYAAHPAFEQKGLGRHAARVFQALAELGEATAEQLVAMSGCSRPTVYRHLSAMFVLQLVGYDPWLCIYWACPERLDDVARDLETQYIPAKRRARIERERSRWRQERSAWRQRAAQ